MSLADFWLLWSLKLGSWVSTSSFLLFYPLLRPLRALRRPVLVVTMSHWCFLPHANVNSIKSVMRSIFLCCISKDCHLFKGNSWNRWSSVGNNCSDFTTFGRFYHVWRHSSIFKTSYYTAPYVDGFLVVCLYPSSLCEPMGISRSPLKEL